MADIHRPSSSIVKLSVLAPVCLEQCAHLRGHHEIVKVLTDAGARLPIAPAAAVYYDDDLPMTSERYQVRRFDRRDRRIDVEKPKKLTADAEECKGDGRRVSRAARGARRQQDPR